MKLALLELEHDVVARFASASAATSRRATSPVTVTRTLPEATRNAFGTAATSAVASTTWKAVTGSKSNAPAPSAAKSYSGATVVHVLCQRSAPCVTEE